MSCHIGIDIGAVSATAALIIGPDKGDAAGPSLQEDDIGGYSLLRALQRGAKLYISVYRRTRGKPIAAATAFLSGGNQTPLMRVRYQ